jgi:protein-S-isoprenylcysteine O-methyltransferase Ste14
VKASAIEFRLRMFINMAIVLVGFLAPWTASLGPGQRMPLLEWLPLELSRLGLLTFTEASPLVNVLAGVFGAIGAGLRIWGTAWLGPATVQNLEMKAGEVIVDGPFRYVRNPLYLGLWFMFVALSFLMPPTGALVAMVLFAVFQMRLILGEEAFLTSRLGQPYLDNLSAVPRLFPRLRTTLPRSGRKPHWLLAVLSEISPIGIFIALAFVSWSYNRLLMARVIIVSFGISVIVRALMPRISKDSGPRE